MIWISHPNDVHSPLAADDIQESAGRIKTNIIRIADHGQFGHHLSRICIEDHEPRGHAAADEKPSVRLIKGHRIIRRRPVQTPFSHHRLLSSIHDRYRGLFWDVHKHA